MQVLTLIYRKQSRLLSLTHRKTRPVLTSTERDIQRKVVSGIRHITLQGLSFLPLKSRVETYLTTQLIAGVQCGSISRPAGRQCTMILQ